MYKSLFSIVLLSSLSLSGCPGDKPNKTAISSAHLVAAASAYATCSVSTGLIPAIQPVCAVGAGTMYAFMRAASYVSNPVKIDKAESKK